MLGGQKISEGYIGVTMDIYNKNDNIDFYNLLKKDKPKKIYLYGINKKYLLTEKLDLILKELEKKSHYIVKKIKKGDLITGLAYKNFNNEFSDFFSVILLEAIFHDYFLFYRFSALIRFL